MAGEPILGKAPACPMWDYRLRMTWPMFRRLRAWAQDVAEREGGAVYLVGSVLYKARPRDLDISIVLPHDEFVARFGPIPEPASDEMSAYLLAIREYLNSAPRHYISDGSKVIRHRTRFDLKCHPDSWWTGKDRLLLADARCARSEEVHVDQYAY